MKKILIIHGDINSLMEQKIREDYGEDVKLYTPEMAMNEGLSAHDFSNTTYKIEAMPRIEERDCLNISGKMKVGKGGRARNKSSFNRMRK